MDGSISDEQAHEWLQEIATASWVSLHFESPALGGTSRGEISGGGYKRAQVAFSQPANRAIWSLADVRFSGLLPIRVTHFGIWSARYKGMIRAYAQLPEPVIIAKGHGYVLHEGDLAISLG
jgi:hypothetical protein